MMSGDNATTLFLNFVSVWNDFVTKLMAHTHILKNSEQINTERHLA